MSNATDAALLRDMRERKGRAPRRSFMPPEEFLRLRGDVLRVTQAALADEMIDPGSGAPVSKYTLCRWERGLSPVPLWAARRITALAHIASTQAVPLPEIDTEGDEDGKDDQEVV